jgi:hypothetical protein
MGSKMPPTPGKSAVTPAPMSLGGLPLERLHPAAESDARSAAPGGKMPPLRGVMPASPRESFASLYRRPSSPDWLHSSLAMWISVASPNGVADSYPKSIYDMANVTFQTDQNQVENTKNVEQQSVSRSGTNSISIRTQSTLSTHSDDFDGGAWDKFKAGAKAVGRGLWSAVKGIATNKVLWGIGLIALAMVCPWTIPAIIVGLAGAALFAYGTYQNTKDTYQLAQDLGLGKGWSGLWAGAAALLNIGAAVATVFTFGAAAGLSIKAQAGVHAAVNWMSSKTGANVAHFAGQAAAKDGALALAGAGLIVLPAGSRILRDNHDRNVELAQLNVEFKSKDSRTDSDSSSESLSHSIRKNPTTHEKFESLREDDENVNESQRNQKSLSQNAENAEDGSQFGDESHQRKPHKQGSEIDGRKMQFFLDQLKPTVANIYPVSENTEAFENQDADDEEEGSSLSGDESRQPKLHKEDSGFDGRILGYQFALLKDPTVASIKHLIPKARGQISSDLKDFQNLCQHYLNQFETLAKNLDEQTIGATQSGLDALMLNIYDDDYVQFRNAYLAIQRSPDKEQLVLLHPIFDDAKHNGDAVLEACTKGSKANLRQQADEVLARFSAETFK